MRHQAELVERAERQWAPRVHLNVMVSGEDEALLHSLAPGAETLVLPNGVDTKEFVPGVQEPQDDIVFVGSHGWFPNLDGMEFFSEKILPHIRLQKPDVAVTWIGRAPPGVEERFAQLGVRMTGYVDDIRPLVQRARCVVVPLRVGGGTRLKILDAWAMGKAVVSTPLGAEGLVTRHGGNILLAGNAEDFGNRVLEVLSNDDLRRHLEVGARTTAVDRYDWAVLGRQMTSRYEKLLDGVKVSD